ncbi:hypothetical protein DY000_02003569 [Brassica cretica]|uniref:Uncharacterized protein n=1 Tax=Brassica cretica TaxID=69181 RepID=A0ABQ7CDU9_BRACR|nr:hypothetical protein DY000_02003569 [Brassica cretica]
MIASFYILGDRDFSLSSASPALFPGERGFYGFVPRRLMSPRKRSRHGSTEAFRQRSSAVGGGGEIGYGFRCWVACFLRQWRLEKGSGDTCASQLRSQHVRRALAFGAVASCFLGLLLSRF